MPPALAAISRIFAREAALKVAEQGLRLVTGAASERQAPTDIEIQAFEAELGMPAIHRAQAGLLADMDFVADVLYGRTVKPEARLAEAAAR